MTQNFVSLNNTTTAPLGPGAEFIGTADFLQGWEELDINVAGSPYNAPGTLYFEFSPDSINWDVSIPLVLSNLMSVPTPLRTVLLYFRVRYINGPVAQTEFRLTTVFHRFNASRLTRFPWQELDYNEPIEVVRVARTVMPDGYDTVTQPRFITDNSGDGYVVTVTPPFTGATSADPALVVAISPNNPITTSAARPSTTNTSSVSASTTNVTLLASNSIRLGATVYNDSSSVLYLKLAPGASLTDFTVRIFPKCYYEVPFGYTGEIDGFWVTASGAARIGELVP